ncbi:extensin family protein [Microvirga pakistanensis]|uniref:extensin family protein n=1 Tax=Microvirga pakistanensis TaxID=1682650 RepID=UPI00106A49FD
METEAGPATRPSLRAVPGEACFFFDVVLSPDDNEAHRDYCHFDMGAYRACR